MKENKVTWSDEEQKSYEEHLQKAEPNLHSVQHLIRVREVYDEVVRMDAILNEFLKSNKNTDKIQKLLKDVTYNDFTKFAKHLLEAVIHAEEDGLIEEQEFFGQAINYMIDARNRKVQGEILPVRITTLSRFDMDEGRNLDHRYAMKRAKEMIATNPNFNGLIGVLDPSELNHPIPEWFDERIKLIDDQDPKSGLKAIVQDGWCNDELEERGLNNIDELVDWDKHGEQVNEILRSAFVTLEVGLTRHPFLVSYKSGDKKLSFKKVRD